MRRLIVILAVSLVALAAAAPASATESYQFRSSGNSAAASFSDFPWDSETIPPGTYFYTDVWASQSINRDNGTVYDDSGLCMFHETFTIDDNGEWTGGTGFGECVSGVDLTLSRKLTSASLTASFPVGTCLAWDDQTGECLDFLDLGIVEIDLDVVGVGPISRYHGTGSWGAAGNYQTTYHGTGSSRDATPSGTIELVGPDGSVIDLTGGLAGHGYLSQSRDGYVEIVVKPVG